MVERGRFGKDLSTGEVGLSSYESRPTRGGVCVAIGCGLPGSLCSMLWEGDAGHKEVDVALCLGT